jgi:CIC family chloride channel protein
LVSLYFIKVYIFITEAFEKIKSKSVRLLGGGLALGVLIFFLPSLYGEGYEEINQSLQGDLGYLFKNTLFTIQENALVVIGLLLAVIIFKVIATSLTFGIGGIGGVFAPSLFIGANTGLLFGKILNYFDFKVYSESSFALVGMAGLIAGVLHAPLTAIFLIAEITGGYNLILPLMITATISYTTIKYFQKNSIYTIQLAKRKELITHHKDKAVLSRMKVVKLIENDFTTVNEESNLGELIKIVAKSRRNIFPVIDNENILQGFITLDNIRDIMFKPELYETVLVRSLMTVPQTFVHPDDSMETVAEKFHASGKYNIPVLKDGKYLGFISKANLFSAYRKLLKRFSEE